MTAVAESDETLEQLAARARAGCGVSFEQIVNLTKDRLFNYLMQILANEHDAEDVAQETFIKAYRNLHRFDGRARFSTWLFAIAKNTALTHLRKRKRHQAIEEIDDVMAPDPADRSRADSIWTLARKLKPKFYETLWLFYGEGFSLKETAEIMKTNTIAVRVNLHRARAALAKRVQKLEQ